MTVKLKTNENKAQEGAKGTETKKEMVVLSVKEESAKTPEAGSLVHKPQTLLPGGRPIEESHLQVVSTYSSVGGSRPVVASGMKISSTLTVSGNRPISAGLLKVSETFSVMGNRPVASNEIDDPSALMGYLD